MKRALCINKINDIQKVMSNESETIETSMVSRDVCEKPENNLLQIIPYVTIYSTNPKDGKINILRYTRANNGSEERLASKVSMGFGGHIDHNEEISYESTYTNEDGTDFYNMTYSNFIETITNCAKRELLEELGVDLEKEFGISLRGIKVAFFIGDQQMDVNKVHIGVSIPVKLTEEHYKKLVEIVKFETTEIESVDNLGVNIDTIIEEMNIAATLKNISLDLSKNLNVEDWSCIVFEYIVTTEINNILANVKYADLYKIAVANDIRAKLQQDIENMSIEELEYIKNHANEVSSALIPNPVTESDSITYTDEPEQSETMDSLVSEKVDQYEEPTM